MINNGMKIIFQEDETLKKRALEVLKQCEICIEEQQADMIIIEIPDNSKESRTPGPVDHEILAKCPSQIDRRLIEEKLKAECVNLDIERICDELISDLKTHMEVEVVSDKKRVYNGRGGMTSEYYLYLLAVLHQEAIGYAGLFKYMISDWLDKTGYTGELDEIAGAGEKGQRYLGTMRKKWMLLGNYAEYFLKSCNLPEAEILTELSAARYEGSESEARIYFSDKGIRTLEIFEETGKDTREIRTGNVRMIRKLMEISKRNAVYLYAEREENGLYVISRLVEESDKEKSCDTYIKFNGFLQWSVMCGMREELTFHYGSYDLNSSKENKQYEQEIRELKDVDVEMVEELVEILREQKHGTAVVISDCAGDVENAVDRLCRLNRGIRISSQICYQREKSKEKRWDKELLLGITGIDGALFMDLQGNCLAIGVLLDGEAKIKGDVGRGARYNSVVNYIQQQEQGIYIGIIISEDGMINILQNNREDI